MCQHSLVTCSRFRYIWLGGTRVVEGRQLGYMYFLTVEASIRFCVSCRARASIRLCVHCEGGHQFAYSLKKGGIN